MSHQESKFLRNAWYMLGWSTDFPAEGMKALTVLGQNLVVYRKSDGEVVALEDLCCHRLVPLSIGRREQDDIRCMYHGLKFGPDGCCKEIPGQTRISSAIRVRNFPVAELHGAAWVWMGVPERADIALIPPIIGPDNPDWALRSAVLEIDCNAALFWENLLDLSHAPYVHETTFGASDAKTVELMTKGEISMETHVLDNGIERISWHVGRQSNPYFGIWPSDDLAINKFLVPGVFILITTSFSPGVKQRGADAWLSEEPILKRTTSQVITPVDDNRCKLFFNFGPWSKAGEHADKFFDVGRAAFIEDKFFVEQQQKMMQSHPDRKVMDLSMDGVIKRFEGVMKRQLEADRRISQVAAG
jgi:vanillate O-demethylase monooxygenase subunit